MLVLSRRTDESVWIGRSIQVKVLEIQNGRVKLGFAAPPDVPVQREEIREASAAAAKRLRPRARRLCEV
ncbi:MAG: carbon storage regulator [Planctomycetaceae bacterium]|nr:carbon storage regulator [Planctomycetaceae bacterium]